MAEASKVAADVLRLGTAAEVRAHLSRFAD
jgi:phosphocarrier protein FPr/phosphocarrier protein